MKSTGVESLRAWLDSEEREKLLCLTRAATFFLGSADREREDDEGRFLAGVGVDLAVRRDFVSIVCIAESSLGEAMVEIIKKTNVAARRILLTRAIESGRAQPSLDSVGRRIRSRNITRLFVCSPGSAAQIFSTPRFRMVSLTKAIIYTSPALRGTLWLHYAFDLPFVRRFDEKTLPPFQSRQPDDGPRWR